MRGNESYLRLRASMCAFHAFTMTGTSARTSRKVVPLPPWKELCFRFRSVNTCSGVSLAEDCAIDEASCKIRLMNTQVQRWSA